MSGLRGLAAPLLFFVAAWQVLVWTTGVPSYILPSPVAVALACIDNAALIAEHAVTTIAEILVGLLLGATLGALTALHLMVSPLARRYLQPLMVFSQTVPVFALAPLLTLWLGYGLGSKIAMCVLIIYFPVASTFYDGLRHTPSGYLDLARSMRAGKASVLLRVRLPAALPSLASGIRLAAVYAPIGAVIGEWVGASSGLGYLMLLANGRVKIDLMFAALLTLSVFTICLHALISRLAARLTTWSGTPAERR